LKEVAKVNVEVAKVNVKMDFCVIDMKVKMRPTTTKLSQGRDGRFRSKLMTYYQNPKLGNMMKCMATGWQVPSEAIRAGHLFPLRLQVT
jgi:hypothetical protein